MDRPASTPADAPRPKHDPYAALRVRDFRLYMTGNFLSVLGLQMQSVGVGWEIYDRTGQPISLAFVGLVQVIPVLCLAIFTGQVADRFNRRRIVMTALVFISASSIGLAVITALKAPIILMYGCLFVAGVARAFQQPAKSSLMPQLVKRSVFPNAVTWNATGFQFASVLGPAAAGLIIALFRSSAFVFVCDATFALGFCALLSQIRYRRKNVMRQPFTAHNLAVGIRYVWRNKVILGASSLDMFAVLFGAAVALLPIYAKDILKVGPTGFGIMQAAPAVGALAMAFLLSHRKPMRHSGWTLFAAVTGFGVATIVFGFSRWFPLSVAMLFVTGAMDNISVVVRQSLIQLLTPDELRGRVSAINGVFITISNEVGDIESGTVAQFFGPVFSAVSGGVGTLVVVALAAWLFPQLRRYGRLDAAVAEPPKPEYI